MNMKLLLGVVVLGAGGSVLALNATAPEAPPASSVAVSIPSPPPLPAVAPPAAKTDVLEPAPVMAAETVPTQQAPKVIRVAASAPPQQLLPAPRVTTPATISPEPEADRLLPQQLDSLLAPIALYPDQLLSQILMASTYPLEVIEAARWIARPENEGLRGERLAAAVEQENWDPSVKALTAFPDILKMLDSDINWMARLGDAFVAEEGAVMDSVQRLRQEAQAAGRLNPDARQQVIIENQQIIIEPANPEVVYVPLYDPREAYGVWAYPDYPPFYIPPPFGFATAPGIYYSFVSVRPFWGWSRWDWQRRHIHIVDVPRYTHYNRGRGPLDRDRWRHDPRHRQGVGNGQRFRDNDRPRRDRDRDNVVNVRPQNVRPDGAANRDFRRPAPDSNEGGRNAGANNGVNGGFNRDENFRTRRQQQPQQNLPAVTAPLPATVPLPAATPPVAVPEPNRRGVGTDNFRARRQQDVDGRDEQRRQRQVQPRNRDQSIGAAPLGNMPPEQRRFRSGSIQDAPLTNIQPNNNGQRFDGRGREPRGNGGQGGEAPRTVRTPPAPAPVSAPPPVSAPRAMAPPAAAPQQPVAQPRANFRAPPNRGGEAPPQGQGNGGNGCGPRGAGCR